MPLLVDGDGLCLLYLSDYLFFDLFIMFYSYFIRFYIIRFYFGFECDS